MDTVRDFEDMLSLLDRHGVRYLIVGGLAIDHPRHQDDARVLRRVRDLRSRED